MIWQRASLTLFTLLLPPSAAAAQHVLPITLHVAEVDRVPVASAAFVETRIARANEIFAPYRIQFRVVARKPLAARHAALETRADRDALGAYFTRGTLHVFCVASLRDVDDPEHMRRGVHWHAKSHPGAHFVIISAISGPNVLAHELGHYLGNPAHSTTAGNLMSYEHTDALPFLDDAQRARMIRRLRSYLARKELVPLPEP